MNSEESKYLLNKWIDIDREGCMGKLSGGLVHAINNLMSASLSQLDLVLLKSGNHPMAAELNHIIDSFDEGIRLTRSIAVMKNAMQPNSTDAISTAIDSIITVLDRIYRRGNFVINKRLSLDTSFTFPNPHLFNQAAYHALHWAFSSLLAESVTPKQLSINYSVFDNKAQLAITLENGAKFMPAGVADAELLPPDVNSVDYYRWMIETICGDSGEFKHSATWETVSISWSKGE